MQIVGKSKLAAELYRPCCGVLSEEGRLLNIASRVKRHSYRFSNRRSLTEYIKTLAEESHEKILAIYVDQQLTLISAHVVGDGDVGGCDVDIGRIYSIGKRDGAAAFFLVHNHPSGDPTPSLQDFRITKRIFRIAEDLEMPLLDHFVVAKTGVRSVLFDQLPKEFI